MSLLVERLKSSPTLRPLGDLEKDWFCSERRANLLADDGSNNNGNRRRRASIALILREVGGSPCDGGQGRVEMLVIKRALRLRDRWSGHVALPGGKLEARETDLQAAVRECEEEVGISLVASRFAVLGRLNDSRTSTKENAITVSCFVFLQTDSSDLALTIQPSEVAHAWWVDTAVFFPAGRSQEVGFAVTSMVKLMKKLPLQALMRLLGMETVFFPCFFLPPPPLAQHGAHTSDSHSHNHRSGVSDTAITRGIDPRDANTFVMWGLTFGVVSDLAETSGGQAFAYQHPPYFRFHSAAPDFLARVYFKVLGWTSGLSRATASTLSILRLQKCSP